MGLSSVQSRYKRGDDGRLVTYTYGGSERVIAVWEQDASFLESIGFRPFVDVVATAPEAPTPDSIGAAIANLGSAPVIAPEPAQEVAALPDDEPAQVADIGEIDAMFNQSALQAATEEKAAQHRQRGRPRKQG
jgi:hypothetical protein